MAKFFLLLFILAGVGMAALGINALTDDTPQCGSRTMKTGDTCTEVNRSSGHTKTRNIEQQRHSDDKTGWILLGFGVPIIALGGFGMVSLFRTQHGDPPPAGSPGDAPRL